MQQHDEWQRPSRRGLLGNDERAVTVHKVAQPSGAHAEPIEARRGDDGRHHRAGLHARHLGPTPWAAAQDQGREHDQRVQW